MNVKLCKLLIFSAGAVIGAVISAVATKKILQKKYWDEFDRELNEQSLRHKDDMKALKEENAELREKISQQNVAIQTLADQISGKKCVNEGGLAADTDAEEDRSKANGVQNSVEGEVEASRRRYSGAFDEENDGVEGDIPGEDGYFSEEEVETEELIVMADKIQRIDETDFDTTCFDYSKEELTYYTRDGKMVTEDGEWMERYPEFVGDFWTGDVNNGDVIFVRNNYYNADYMITVKADFGENFITCSDSEWED